MTARIIKPGEYQVKCNGFILTVIGVFNPCDAINSAIAAWFPEAEAA